jgi:hypothetical protein
VSTTRNQPDPKVPFATIRAFDGRDPKLQQWVTDSGAVALLADNDTVEATPAVPCADDYRAMLPLHAHGLFKPGCYLGEMRYPTERADWLRTNGRNRFTTPVEPFSVQPLPSDRSADFVRRLSVSAWAPPRFRMRRKSDLCTATRLMDPSASTSTTRQLSAT